MADLLLSSTPSAPLAGTYILHLPTPAINVRRFTPSLPADTSGGEGDSSEILWRTLAERADAEVGRMLDSGVGVVDADREVWFFSCSKVDIDLPEGFEELAIQTLAPQTLLTCPAHPTPFECLSYNTCLISLKQTSESLKMCDMLANAIVETCAWKKGARAVLRASGVVPIEPRWRPHVYPLSSTSLLLTINPSCSPAPPTTCTHHLLPLSLPTTFLSPLKLALPQTIRLEAAFDALIGRDWKKGRESLLTRELVMGQKDTQEWAVYWVPLRQEGEGVLTVWPGHLAAPIKRVQEPEPSAPIIHPPKAEPLDMMGAAHDLYEFFSSYREPSPKADGGAQAEDPDPAEDEDEDTMDVDKPPTRPASRRQSIVEEDSEFDDLFDSPSSSPVRQPIEPYQPPLAVPPVQPEPETDAMDFGDSLVHIRDPTPPPATATRTRETVEEREPDRRDEVGLVTEDDFAFFDSPGFGDFGGMGVDIDSAPVIPEAPPVNVAEGEMDVDDLLAGLGLPVDAPAPAPEPKEEAAEDETTPAPASPSPPPLPPTPMTIPPKTKPPQLHPLIPYPYAPISLQEPPRFHAYAPPSPAPTPETSLVERLSAKRKRTYADDWTFEQSSDDGYNDGEEVDYTGPPTPVSDILSDSDEPTRTSSSRASLARDHTPSNAIAGAGQTEIKWHGTRCVGPEWVVLRDTGVDEFKTTWDGAWRTPDMMPLVENGVKAGARQSGDVDWEKVVREVITNRSFRRTVLGKRDAGDEQRGRGVVDDVVNGGDALSAFSEHGETRMTVPPQPQITTSTVHTPLILRLSVSALSYWSELGLAPQSGRKNIKLGVVSDDPRQGREMADGLKKGWEDLRFGQTEWVNVGKDGVIAGIQTFLDTSFSTLLKLLEAEHHLVLFIALAPGTHPPSRLFSPSFFTPANVTLIPLPLPAFPNRLTLNDYRVLSREAYDRLPLLLTPIQSRGEPLWTHDRYISAPAWTLASHKEQKPEFQLAFPIEGWDVLNRWRWWHLAYDVVPATSSVLSKDVAVVVWISDDRGEAWEVQMLSKEKDWKERVGKIHAWGKKVAGSGTKEWNLSVCRVGAMDREEWQAWRDIIANEPLTLLLSTPSGPATTCLTDPCPTAPPRPRAIANISPAILTDPNTSIIDTSLAGHITHLPFALPAELLSSPSLLPQTIYPQSTFLVTLPGKDGVEHKTVSYHLLSHKPRRPCQEKDKEAEKEDVKAVGKELAEEYYRLSCLARQRWGGEGWLDAVRWGRAVIEEMS
ncbi:hypothetical protein B9479_000432 [Cryptococcus floricola]|uniref:Mediator of RNA polymerase II transcription subunit 13 n=1 Tax=Cryptococcus floricola TaxID=2591691 RepID=A0A5D3BA52_9TREE|nr:hypothetical protein B9479_000432 [Cryptococcus floricola]